jgi:hypothetical protein
MHPMASAAAFGPRLQKRPQGRGGSVARSAGMPFGLWKRSQVFTRWESSGSRAAEAVPCGEQDGDGDEWRGPGRWIVWVMPVVDGVTQAGEREEDAEDGRERPMMPLRALHCAETGAGWWRDPSGAEYLCAIDHRSPQKPLQLPA